MRYVQQSLLTLLTLLCLSSPALAQSFEDFLGRFPKVAPPYNLPVEEIAIHPNQKLPYYTAKLSVFGPVNYLGARDQTSFLGLDQPYGTDKYVYPIARLSEPAGDVHGVIIGELEPGQHNHWQLFILTYTSRGELLDSQLILDLAPETAPMVAFGELSVESLTDVTTTRRVVIREDAELTDKARTELRPYAETKTFEIDAKGTIKETDSRRTDLDR